MDNMIYILFVCIFFPILLMALLVEKKARHPIIFVLVGIFISVLASEINGILLRLLNIDFFRFTTTVTPIAEEILKALPVLLYAIIVSDKRERLFTASMATGIGFAVIENAYFILNHSNFNMLDAIIRAFGSGLMHGMCTLLVGVGISFVKVRRKLFAVGSFSLLSAAITYHGIYNMLIQSDFEIIGALLPIATYIPFFIHRTVLKKKESQKITDDQPDA